MENEINAVPTTPVAPVAPVAPVVTTGNSKLLAVLSYLGAWIFALLVKPEKDSEYVRNHAKNGIIVSVLALVNIIPFIGQLAYIVVIVFAIIGIVKAFKGETYELPVVGGMFPTLNVTKVLSVYCYTSAGALFCLLADEKDDPVLKSHMNNGIWFMILSLVNCVPFIGQLAYIAVIVFAIIGIVKGCKGEAYDFPLVGGVKIVK